MGKGRLQPAGVNGLVYDLLGGSAQLERSPWSSRALGRAPNTSVGWLWMPISPARALHHARAARLQRARPRGL